MPDLYLRYDLRPRTDTLPVFLESGSGELNPLTLIPSRDFYAFLQSVEEVDSGELDQERRTPVDLPAATPDEPPETLGMDDDDRGDGEAWVVARFEAIEAAYFNANIDDHRQFYASELGVDIDAPRLPRVHWHDATQTLAHRQLNHQLLDVREPWMLPVLVLTFRNTADNWSRFRGLFPEDHWVGLTLHDKSLPLGLRLTACLGDDEDVEQDWTLLAIHSVAPTRLNNLVHVISLDFAPDAYIEGTQPELPKPLTVREAEILRRLGKWMREDRQRDPRRRGKVKKKILRPSDSLKNEVLFKPWRTRSDKRYTFVVRDFRPSRPRVVKVF